ncbi:MAG: UDP-N-acetylmuramate dehydrogenase [Muribaculaceae bacterium]|nr:UDP-N-acetylmuramate dehydrogenase [Roseburia sp.]MCM1430197.1 UDP-N-acetylmuramate dehydrogenase [Muribaculaceae bacterium]MCM1493127.1 UDP-N-acetylmuramate dehydrogenase [Muribaculaceae bacterium]
MENFQEFVMRELPQLDLLREEPMERHTTFRIGGPAEYYARPAREELAPLLRLARSAGVPVTVIGNGSNLLVADSGIRGLVVEIGGQMSRVRIEGTKLVASAGALLSAVASAAAAAGLGGLEFAAGIPGNLGGAIVMNAGAYGGEMKDVVESVTALTPDGQLQSLCTEELDFGYRHSSIPDRNHIVVEAVLTLTPKPEEEIRAEMAELRRKRLHRQPLEFPSAGSTFKRPEGNYAGKLIMDAGLRGYTVGGAQVSEKHCGFVVNTGGAAAADVLRLMRDVQEKVRAAFGVHLEPEVKLLGDFDTGM